MNQIVLHNYSVWSMSAVLREMSTSLENRLGQSPKSEVERNPIVQEHENPCKGKSVTDVSIHPELWVSISFFTMAEDRPALYNEEGQHVRINYRDPYDSSFILGLVAAMFSQHGDVFANALKSAYTREFALKAAFGLYKANIKVDSPSTKTTIITIDPGIPFCLYHEDVLVETTGGVTCTPGAPAKVETAPLLAVGDLVMGSMLRENGSRHNVLCAQVKGVVKKIIGGYHYVCAEFDLNAWIADTKYKGIMDESDVMVQYDKEKLRVIHEKMELLDNYATSLFGEYPFNRQRPVIAPSFEMEILMPVKKNFLKPDGSEDDVYIAAAILQENGQDATTKEKQCAK